MTMHDKMNRIRRNRETCSRMRSDGQQNEISRILYVCYLILRSIGQGYYSFRYEYAGTEIVFSTRPGHDNTHIHNK